MQRTRDSVRDTGGRDDDDEETTATRRSDAGEVEVLVAKVGKQQRGKRLNKEREKVQGGNQTKVETQLNTESQIT